MEAKVEKIRKAAEEYRRKREELLEAAKELVKGL